MSNAGRMKLKMQNAKCKKGCPQALFAFYILHFAL
jgi:hypothetical protein